MRNHLLLAVCVLLALAFPGVSAAQYTSSLGINFNNPGSALIGTMIANRLLADAARKGAADAGRKGAAKQPDVAAGRPAPSSRRSTEPGPDPEAQPRLTFRPVARNLMVKELADTLVNDGPSRRQLSQAFEEYLRNFDEQARRDREPSNDVGRAAAYFVMVNYYAATGREPTDAQADGAQATFREGLATNPTFAEMSDRDRQRLYESLVILGTLPLAGAVQSGQEGDREQEKMYREFAAELVKTLLGVPVQKIRLTANGFRFVD